MAKLEWSESLKLGVESMDQDHKFLISLMNKLEALEGANAEKDQISQCFNDLLEFTVKHFSKEEEFMESMQFDGLNSHKLIHKELLRRLGDHHDEFNKTGVISEGLMDFLVIWLKSHICGIDAKYAKVATKGAA